MQFIETPIAGAYLITPELVSDNRGFFVRTFDSEIFRKQGLVADFPQHSIAFNLKNRTLRGLHYQHAPYAETKLVRCVNGEIYDVLLDIRPESPSFMNWHAVTLSAASLNTLYIPAGCAHGYLTLKNESLVEYLMDKPYVPASARGVRYDDPLFSIDWPDSPVVISERDKNYPNFDVRT